jgi:hypothetical protein
MLQWTRVLASNLYATRDDLQQLIEAQQVLQALLPSCVQERTQALLSGDALNLRGYVITCEENGAEQLHVIQRLTPGFDGAS